MTRGNGFDSWPRARSAFVRGFVHVLQPDVGQHRRVLRETARASGAEHQLLHQSAIELWAIRHVVRP